MTESDSILGALGIAAAEQKPSGQWTILPGAPPWFDRVLSESSQTSDGELLDVLLAAFPFLETFLPDCEQFWDKRSPGRLVSDFWTQTDQAGHQHHLQASAICSENHNWFLIEDASGRFREQQLLQQYAHDSDLLSRNLKRANQSKSNFLATVSHEIRTPLNAILGVADLLAGTPLNADQREYVAVFQRAGGNLLSLLNDLLDLSKVEAGRLTIEAIPFDLRAVAEDAVEALSVRAHSKGLELCLGFDPNLNRFCVGDPHRLRQVLLNLIGNAIKFTSRGEVVLRLQRVSDATLYVSVSDTGIGIPPDKLRSIFDEYVQAESGTTREYGGTGLGLSICKQIVERMGGRIAVESKPGAGSTFRFELSLPTTYMQAPVEDVNLDGLRVLIWTLSSTNASIIKELAANWRAKEVVIAGEPPHVDGFDLALADLPLLESEATARHGHLLARTTIPLIASHNRIIDQPRCQGLGLTTWLVKPILPTALSECLKRQLTGTQAVTSQPVEPTASLSGLRILIADDSPDNRFLLCSYLRNSGAELITVNDGAAAVDQFVSAPFDLVLIDVQMPILDGYAAVTRMREHERRTGRRRTPILMLTAGTLEAEFSNGQAAGASALLMKPIQRSTLLAAIEEHTSKRLVVAVDPQLKEIVPWYLDSRRRDLPEFSAALSAGDFGRLRTLGHNLRGTGSSYGFPKITHIGEAIESAAKAADADTCRNQIEELTEYLARVEWRVND